MKVLTDPEPPSHWSLRAVSGWLPAKKIMKSTLFPCGAVGGCLASQGTGYWSELGFFLFATEQQHSAGKKTITIRQSETMR